MPSQPHMQRMLLLAIRVVGPLVGSLRGFGVAARDYIYNPPNGIGLIER